MSNDFEGAWNEFRKMTEYTYIDLCDAIFKNKTDQIKDAHTQQMMMSKLMYTLDDLERKYQIKRDTIITP
jgi:hypothetical protein